MNKEMTWGDFRKLRESLPSWARMKLILMADYRLEEVVQMWKENKLKDYFQQTQEMYDEAATENYSLGDMAMTDANDMAREAMLSQYREEMEEKLVWEDWVKDPQLKDDEDREDDEVITPVPWKEQLEEYRRTGKTYREEW